MTVPPAWDLPLEVCACPKVQHAAVEPFPLEDLPLEVPARLPWLGGSGVIDGAPRMGPPAGGMRQP